MPTPRPPTARQADYAQALVDRAVAESIQSARSGRRKLSSSALALEGQQAMPAMTGFGGALSEGACGAMAGMGATLVSSPTDVAKARLQLQGELGAGSQPLRGLSAPAAVLRIAQVTTRSKNPTRTYLSTPSGRGAR